MVDWSILVDFLPRKLARKSNSILNAGETSIQYGESHPVPGMHISNRD